MDSKPHVTVIPAKPNIFKNVVIYARVSSNSQEQLLSLTNQISYLTRLVHRRIDWQLVDIYIDIQSGSSSSSRFEFQRMISDCTQKKVDQIITKSVSRFGRNTVETLDALNKLRALGIDVYFDTEEIHSLDGKNIFLLTILEGVAQEENLARSENIKWGIQKGIQSGRSKIFDRKCFGYIQNKEGSLIIQESEATTVKLIFDLYLSGYSINAIRKEFQIREINSPTGHEMWSKRTVDTMLQNEKYTGDVVVMKTYSEGYPKVSRKINRGEHEKYITLDSHPAIISRDVFDKVKTMREERSNIISGSEGNIRKPTRYSMKKAMENADNSAKEPPISD